VQAELQRFYTVALAIHPENTRRLRKMTARQYERLLHPAFEDDEWILIVLGGVIGLVVGLAQRFLL